MKDDTNKKEMIPYFVFGKRFETRSGDVPNEPMLVIKENERVEVRTEGGKIGEFEEVIGNLNGVDFINRVVVPCKSMS